MANDASKSAYQQILLLLGQLTRSELDDLTCVAMVLREAMDKSPEEVHKELERLQARRYGKGASRRRAMLRRILRVAMGRICTLKGSAL